MEIISTTESAARLRTIHADRADDHDRWIARPIIVTAAMAIAAQATPLLYISANQPLMLPPAAADQSSGNSRINGWAVPGAPESSDGVAARWNRHHAATAAARIAPPAAASRPAIGRSDRGFLSSVS